MVGAIETVYRGYRFRSRLEARWAVFMDTAGCQWVYEPEGFDLGDDGWYLPDFFCRHNKTHGTYIEIKPTEPNDKEINKLVSVCSIENQHGIFIWGVPGEHMAFEIHKDGFVYRELEGNELMDILLNCPKSSLQNCINAARAARFEHGERP